MAACQAMFPNQRFIDSQAYGIDSAGTGSQQICTSNGYSNGLVYTQLEDRLANHYGLWGMATFLTLGRDATAFTEFTQTGDNYFTLAALRGAPYEVSWSFHNFSTETFSWLDDTTNNIWAAEITRPARGTTVVFANGGPTSTTLAFQSATDTDAFQVPVARSSQYTISATTSSSAVDLCISVYTSTGTFLGSAAGCTDGTSGTLRNASITVSTNSSDRLIAMVSNVLGLSGWYDFRVQNVGDDHPNDLPSAYVALPMVPNEPMNGNIESTSDHDMFRYDRPSTAGAAALSFSTTVLTGATIEVWFTTGTTIPSGSPTWVGTGTVAIGSPSVGHYYVRVGSAITGAYQLYANTCGGAYCNDTGTYSTPLSLPTVDGGFVWDRLDAAGSGNNSSQCENGSICDWYQISLAANERVSVTTYDVFNSSCGLEVAVYAPPDQGHWVDGGGWHFPALHDVGGSMETNGAQLDFVARHGGTHRIRVRTTTASTCPRYVLGVARGHTDTGFSAPPPYH